MIKNCGIPLIDQAASFLKRTALVDPYGSYSYRQLLQDSESLAIHLLGKDRKNLNGERILFLVPSSYAYVVAQWAIWRAGGIAVPLCVSHPLQEWAYVVQDTQAKRIIAHPSLKSRILPLKESLSLDILDTNDLKPSYEKQLPLIPETKPALIIYTSGTTGKPKGVVMTHFMIKMQVKSLVEAWEWSKDDYILNVLPLHHVHGIVNVLTCALWSGAKCQLHSKFEAAKVIAGFVNDGLNVFMAVPTIYHRLIAAYDKMEEKEKTVFRNACRNFRLMVSGSAALPVQVLERWKAISGHTLLERYGMTEIGMALSNSYQNERIPGYVGLPLPRVETKIVDEDGKEIVQGEVGELWVKGPTVFHEYWGKPEETKKAFINGWFQTGDVVTQNKQGIFRIVGRNSVDIIKTGGYKVSALEIEETLRQHPDIAECAVVGLPDEAWGQTVAAMIIFENNKPSIDFEELKNWTKKRLAKYKVPSKWMSVKELPRNAMGKVTKPAIVKIFDNE